MEVFNTDGHTSAPPSTSSSWLHPSVPVSSHPFLHISASSSSLLSISFVPFFIFCSLNVIFHLFLPLLFSFLPSNSPSSSSSSLVLHFFFPSPSSSYLSLSFASYSPSFPPSFSSSLPPSTPPPSKPPNRT